MLLKITILAENDGETDIFGEKENIKKTSYFCKISSVLIVDSRLHFLILPFLDYVDNHTVFLRELSVNSNSDMEIKDVRNNHVLCCNECVA